MGTVKADGGHCAREWPGVPPGADYHDPPPAFPPAETGTPPAGWPVAAFSYTPAAPVTTDLVTFDATASQTGDGGPIVSYGWLFSNAVTRSGVTCTWRLPSAHGSYDATLTVTDAGSQSDTITQVLTI